MREGKIWTAIVQSGGQIVFLFSIGKDGLDEEAAIKFWGQAKIIGFVILPLAAGGIKEAKGWEADSAWVIAAYHGKAFAILREDQGREIDQLVFRGERFPIWVMAFQSKLFHAYFR